jgi:hypothetical protein
MVKNAKHSNKAGSQIEEIKRPIKNKENFLDDSNSKSSYN